MVRICSMMGNEVPERAATVLNGKIQMVCDDDAVERVSIGMVTKAGTQ